MLLFTSAAATILPQPGIETQGITLTTDVSALGVFSNDADLSWRHSSEVLDANLKLIVVPDRETGELIEIWVVEPEPPLSYDTISFEVQMNTVYAEDTRAQYGQIAYSKNSKVDTKALPASMFNVENDRIITYTGVNSNRILSEENVMLSGAGTPGVPTALSTTCPLCHTTDCYPGFCSSMDTGSKIDMSVVSVSTSAEVRNLNHPGGGGVEHWPPVPSVEGLARVNYNIRVAEISSTQPSIGYVSTYLNLEQLEGINLEQLEGGTALVNVPRAIQDMHMKERKSVDGYISLFSNSVEYESGICCR